MKPPPFKHRDVDARWQARWRERANSESSAALEPEILSAGDAASTTPIADGDAGPEPRKDEPTKDEPTKEPGRGKPPKRPRLKTHYVFATPFAPREGVAGLGDVRRFVAADVYARIQGAMGARTFVPVGLSGWERELLEAAIARGSTPGEVLESRWEPVRAAVDRLGVQWEATSPVRDDDPSYFRWTQWLFLQLLRRRLLSYEPARAPAGSDDDAVESDGFLAMFRERTTREKDEGGPPAPGSGRWILRLSSYGDRLLSDLGKANWSIDDRNAQRYRIGRLRGCELTVHATTRFGLECEELEVFTTRIEALYGGTFVLVHPWHPIVDHVIAPGYEDEVRAYRRRVRQELEPRLSGQRTGGYAINPINLQKIPIVISRLAMEAERGDAILAVPAHDPLLFELARRLRLPIREVIRGKGSKYDVSGRLAEAYTGEGVMTNSGPINELPQKVARERIIHSLSRRAICRRTTRFFLDTLAVSDASPWGVPVPIVHCRVCGIRPVPEERLPVEPPPLDVGELAGLLDGPARRDLSAREGFGSTVCPSCGARATRDPHVIAPWLGLSWMFLRHIAPDLGGVIEGMPGAVEDEPPAPAEGIARDDDWDSEAPVITRSTDVEGAASDATDVDSTEPVPGDDGGGGVAGAGDDSVPAGDKTGGEDDDGDDDGEDDARVEGVRVDAPPGEAYRVEGADGDPSEKGKEGGNAPPASPSGVVSPAVGASPVATADSDEASDAEGPTESVEPKDGSGAGEMAGADEIDEDGADDDGADDGVGAATESGDESDSEESSQTDGAAQGVNETRSRGRRRRVQQRDEARQGGADDDDDDMPAPALFDEPSKLRPFSSQPVRQWLPVDTGIGTIGSGIMGVLQARFLAKFLYDLREVSSYEPFYRFARVGPVVLPPAEADALSSEGAVPPITTLAETYGADAVRLYLLSNVGITSPLVFRENELWAISKLLRRIWFEVHVRLSTGKFVSRRVLVAKHELIHELSRSLRRFRFHRAIAAVATFLKFMRSADTTKEEMDRASIQTFIVLLAPLAPHLAAELWDQAGGQGELEAQPWPEASSELLHPSEVEIPIMIEGRVRHRMTVPADLNHERLEALVRADPDVQRKLSGRLIDRLHCVPGKAVNIRLETVSQEG